ncbi:adenosylcobinamide-GDP ribazoletransferase, partial [Vibrio furnissii]
MPAALLYQWQLFLLAVSFFSRLPVPASLPYSSERMNQAGRYFALVGVLLG